MDSGGDQDSLGGPPRPASAGTQRSDGSGGSLPRNGSGSVTDMHALAPLPRPDSGGSLAAQAAAALAAQAAAALQAQAAALGGGGGGGGQREEGELPSPEPSPEQRGAPQHHHLQPPAASPPQGSPGKEARGERSRRAEVASRVRAAWDEAQRSGTLSARQSARIADFSLLLEVVLKTNTLRWGSCGRWLLGAAAVRQRAVLVFADGRLGVAVRRLCRCRAEHWWWAGVEATCTQALARTTCHLRAILTPPPPGATPPPGGGAARTSSSAASCGSCWAWWAATRASSTARSSKRWARCARPGRVLHLLPATTPACSLSTLSAACRPTHQFLHSINQSVSQSVEYSVPLL